MNTVYITVLFIPSLVLMAISFFIMGFSICRLKTLNRIEVKDNFTRMEVLYIVTGKGKPNEPLDWGEEGL